MSTVHIRLKDIFDAAVTCHVIFYPEDTPYFSGAALAVSGAHSILIDADGEGSVTLLPGRYTVRFAKITGNTDTLIILVPTEEGTYELQNLVCAGTWVLPFRDFLQKSQNLADLPDKAAAFAAIAQSATATATGAVRLATQTEVDAGTDGVKALTPATLAGASKWAALNPLLKVVGVADAATRLALTPSQVNRGDWVVQTDTRAVYLVLDTAMLSQEQGYVETGTRPAAAVVSTLASGLQAEWLFASGSELADTSGNGNTLSNTNGVTFETADGIAAAVFSGSDELDSAPLTPGNALTIAFLAKNSVASGYIEAFAWDALTAYTYHASVSAPAWNYDYYGSPNAVGAASEGWHFMSARFSAGTWIVTCDDASLTFAAPLIAANSVLLGHYGFAGGRVAQVRIWNRALTDTELATVRTNGATHFVG